MGFSPSKLRSSLVRRSAQRRFVAEVDHATAQRAAQELARQAYFSRMSVVTPMR